MITPRVGSTIRVTWRGGIQLSTVERDHMSPATIELVLSPSRRYSESELRFTPDSARAAAYWAPGDFSSLSASLSMRCTLRACNHPLFVPILFFLQKKTSASLIAEVLKVRNHHTDMFFSCRERVGK